MGSGWGIHVNPWLIHVKGWLKPLQYCKVKKKKQAKLTEGDGSQDSGHLGEGVRPGWRPQGASGRQPTRNHT